MEGQLEETAPGGEGRGHPLRRLYDWVLGWAQSPYGAPALFGLALAEAIFFPIPPDVLLMALVLGQRERAWYFMTISTIGSVVGGLIGYLVGSGLWTVTSAFFFQYIPGFDQIVFDKVRVLYETYSFWAVFAAGFTPIPFKVFTITAGVFEISLPIFLLAAVLSRGLRFFMVGGLLWYFGEPITKFIDRYFNLLALLFMALLIGGFFLFKYL